LNNRVFFLFAENKGHMKSNMKCTMF